MPTVKNEALARPKLTCATTQRAEAVAQKLRQRQNTQWWDELDREAVFAIDALVAFTKSLINHADTVQPEQKIAHPNPAAKHWHDLYRAKCQEFHDKQTMLGTEIVALEEELEEIKEEIEPLRLLAKMKPRGFVWYGLTEEERNEMIGRIQHDKYTRQRDLIGSTQITTEMYLKEKNHGN